MNKDIQFLLNTYNKIFTTADNLPPEAVKKSDAILNDLFNSIKTNWSNAIEIEPMEALKSHLN